MKIILMLFLTLIVAGCTGQYIKPEAGPTAMVRIKTENDLVWSWLHTYKEEGCKSPASMGAIGTRKYVRPNQHNEPKGMLGGKNEVDTQIVEQIIAANKPFTVLFTQIGPHGAGKVRGCSIPITFMPQQDYQYEIDYDFDWKVCSVLVSELSLEENGNINKQSIKVAKEVSACSPFRF